MLASTEPLCYMNNIDTLIKGLAIEGIIALYKKQNREVGVEYEDILKRHEKIMDAYKNWHELDFNQKLEIAKIANEECPDAVVAWDRDVEGMKDSPFVIPSSIKAYVGNERTKNMLNWFKSWVFGENGGEKKVEQEGGILDLDNLKYNGHELPDDFKEYAKSHRGKNN